MIKAPDSSKLMALLHIVQFSNVLREKYDRMFHFNWMKLSEPTEIKYFHIKNLLWEGIAKILYFHCFIHSANFHLGNKKLLQYVVGGEFTLNCWLFLCQNFTIVSGLFQEQYCQCIHFLTIRWEFFCPQAKWFPLRIKQLDKCLLRKR